MSVLNHARILLGITGGIAAYRSAYLAGRLRQAGADVRVVMTESAQKFVTRHTFAALTGNHVYTDMWAEQQYDIKHVTLADWPQLTVVAPATANTMAKVAHGLCDDLLSTTILTTTAPVLFAPAMSMTMWSNPATQRNIEILREFGYHFIGPNEGWLACDKVGPGRMAEPEELAERITVMLEEL